MATTKAAPTTTPQTHANIHAALAAFQAELPSIAKGNTADVQGRDGKRGYSYSYADLTAISEAALPLLGRHGLYWHATPAYTEQGAYMLTGKITHESGEWIEGVWPLKDPRQVGPQAAGSELTYARRYLLCTLTGVAPGGDDDDAHSSQAQHQWEPPAPAAPPAPQLTDEEWMARANAAETTEATVQVWRMARMPGAASVETVQAIGDLAKARKEADDAEAQTAAEVQAQDDAGEPEPTPEDAEAAEAAAIAAHEAELAAQS